MAEHSTDICVRALDPIFVLGAGRSGTTLLASMIGNHPQVGVAPESHFLSALLPVFRSDRRDPDEILDAICNDWSFKAWRWHLAKRPEQEGLRWTFREAVEWVYRRYAEDHDKARITAFVEHTPHNVRSVNAINRCFPEARFVHIVRDGRAVAASLLPTDWGPENTKDAANYWLLSVGLCFTVKHLVGDTRFLTIQYEDLITRPEDTMRRVAAFLGLDFDPSMLASSGLAVQAESQDHKLVGQPPDPSKMSTWKASLSDRQIEIFEIFAGDMLEALGYQRLHRNPRHITLAESVSRHFWSALRRAYHIVQRKRAKAWLSRPLAR